MTQRDTLVKLVKFQGQSTGELVFALRPTGQGHNDERDVDVYPLGSTGGETVITIPGEYVRLWADAGYITAGQRWIKGEDTQTFILRQKALDLLLDQEW